MNGRPLILTATLVATALGMTLCGSVRADFLTTQVVVNQTQPGPAATSGPTVNNVTRISGSGGSGELFANRYFSPTASPTLAVGDTVRLVGVDVLSGPFRTGLGGSGSQSVNYGGTIQSPNQMLVIFALSGTTTNATNLTADFDPSKGGKGAAVFISLTNTNGNTFVATNPLTWNFSAGAANANQLFNLFTRGTIANPNGIFPGTGQGDTIPAFIGNNPNINISAAALTGTQQTFLSFLNGGVPAGDPNAGNYITSPLSPPSTIGLVGLASTQFDSVLRTPDIGTLNAISQALLGLNFADNSQPGISNYSQTGSLAADTVSGDVAETLGINVDPFLVPPTITTIPEPTSMLLFGMAALGLGAYRGVRRYRMKKAA